MRLYIAVAGIFAVLAALASAAPNFSFSWLNWTSRQHQTPQYPSASENSCMTPSDTETTADVFRLLIQNYTTTLALTALTPSFHDWASSVNIIINKGGAGPKSMDAPTFASRAAFIDGQGKQPPIPFEKIKVWGGCRFVAMRWKTGRSANGHETEIDDIPVHGNVILEVEPSEPGNVYNWRISNIWSEFNSAAWLVNLGMFKPGGMPLEAQDVQHMEQFADEVVEAAAKGGE